MTQEAKAAATPSTGEHTMPDENKRAMEDGNAWDAFGKLFGWRLNGWTYQDRASFWIDEGEEYRHMIQIDRWQRESLQKAMDRRAINALTERTQAQPRASEGTSQSPSPREEALEEAARVAESGGDAFFNYSQTLKDQDARAIVEARASGCWRAAAAIRALKDRPHG